MPEVAAIFLPADPEDLYTNKAIAKFSITSSGTNGLTTTGLSSQASYLSYSAEVVNAKVMWKGQDPFVCLNEWINFPLVSATPDIKWIASHMDLLSSKDNRLLLCQPVNKVSHARSLYLGLGTGSILSDRGTAGTFIVAAPGSSNANVQISSEGNESEIFVEDLFLTMWDMHRDILRTVELGNRLKAMAIPEVPTPGSSLIRNGSYLLAKGANGTIQINGSLQGVPTHTDYSDIWTQAVAEMSPLNRDVFFRDLSKMDDKVFDYVMCKFLRAFKMSQNVTPDRWDRNLGHVFLEPPECPLTDTPRYRWEAEGYRCPVFELFLWANRDRPKILWSDLFRGSHANGFGFPETSEMFPNHYKEKPFVDVELDLRDIPQMLAYNILEKVTSGERVIPGFLMHGYFTDFPKLPRYDLNPLQRVSLYLMIGSHSCLSKDRVLSMDMSWIWSPDLEAEVVKSWTTMETGTLSYAGSGAFESGLSDALNKITRYLKDGEKLYSLYLARYNMLPIAGHIRNRLLKSAHNHAVEELLTMEERIEVLGFKGALLPCAQSFPRKLEKST
jgi:hypothetical protein